MARSVNIFLVGEENTENFFPWEENVIIRVTTITELVTGEKNTKKIYWHHFEYIQ